MLDDPFADVPLSPLQTRKTRGRRAAPVQRKKRGHPEDDLHRSAFNALRKYFLPEDAVCTSWETRNAASFIEGANRKSRGVTKGWPDSGFFWRGQAAMIEWKADNGRVSDAQTAVHLRLKAAGVPVAVCRSLEDAVRFFESIGWPLRARVGA